MLIYQSIALLALLALAYSAASGYLERTPVNGALVYTAFGVLLGSAGLGLFDLAVDAEGLRIIAELTLCVVLFSDAAGVDYAVLQQQRRLPERLLGIGLPLTILAGCGAGLLLFPDLSLIEIAIVATMLAPTDAALGKAVVVNPAVPARTRTALNVESGLNDGICVPVVFALLAMTAAGDAQPAFARYVVSELGIGALAGMLLAAVGARLVNLASARGWMTRAWEHQPVLALAVLCFAVAQLLGGSGFIAAFCGGLVFGRLARKHKKRLLEAGEASGNLLSMITWVIFGAVMVGPSLGAFGWDTVAYAVLSLTVLRALPVLVSLVGSGVSPREQLFLAWFGPRGLASIVLALLVMHDNLPGFETMAMAVICTVFLSVILHGVTANPLVARLARRAG